MRLRGIEPLYQAWKASVMAFILQPQYKYLHGKFIQRRTKSESN